MKTQFWLILLAAILFRPVAGQDEGQPAPRPKSPDKVAAPSTEGLIPLNEQKTILLDREAGKVILETELVFRSGLLEMLVCLKQTKEHESILSFDGKAANVHAGLLALGVEPGTTVQFLPEYKPPSGPVIDIFLMWRDEQKTWHRVNAKEWIRGVTRRYFVEPLATLPTSIQIPEDSDLRYDKKHQELLWFGLMDKSERDALLKLSTDKAYHSAVHKLFKQAQLRPMTADWVFAGSGIHKDEATGQEYYLAESGDLICVANFSSATLDVREQSSADSEGGLSYEAWEERIPPLGTKVRVELVPRKPPQPATKPADDPSKQNAP